MNFSFDRQWDSGEWGPCSTSCEIGEQSKPVYCKAVRPDGVSFVTSDSKCLETYRIKPQYIRSCNENVKCPEWETTEWSKVRFDSQCKFYEGTVIISIILNQYLNINKQEDFLRKTKHSQL